MKTMMMAALLLVVAALFERMVEGVPLPPACQDGRTDVVAATCNYGSTIDKCGKRVCLKGPGEICGGVYGR